MPFILCFLLKVDVRSGMLGLLLNSAGNTSLVSGSGRAFIQLSTDGTAEVASTGTSTVTLRSRASNSPVSSSSSSSTSSGSGSEESGHRVAGGLLLAVDPTVVANTATGSGGPNNGHPHVLSGGWINLTAGAAVGINGGGLVLESGETTRGPVVDQAEAEKVCMKEENVLPSCFPSFLFVLLLLVLLVPFSSDRRL